MPSQDLRSYTIAQESRFATLYPGAKGYPGALAPSAASNHLRHQGAPQLLTVYVLHLVVPHVLNYTTSSFAPSPEVQTIWNCQDYLHPMPLTEGALPAIFCLYTLSVAGDRYCGEVSSAAILFFRLLLKNTERCSHTAACIIFPGRKPFISPIIQRIRYITVQ